MPSEGKALLWYLAPKNPMGLLSKAALKWAAFWGWSPVLRLRQQLNPGLLSGPPDSWPPRCQGHCSCPLLSESPKGALQPLGGCSWGLGAAGVGEDFPQLTVSFQMCPLSIKKPSEAKFPRFSSWQACNLSLWEAAYLSIFFQSKLDEGTSSGWHWTPLKCLLREHRTLSLMWKPLPPAHSSNTQSLWTFPTAPAQRDLSHPCTSLTFVFPIFH